MTNRRSFLAGMFRATATVAFLGVARLSVADGPGFEREPYQANGPLWPGLHDLWQSAVEPNFLMVPLGMESNESKWLSVARAYK